MKRFKMIYVFYALLSTGMLLTACKKEEQPVIVEDNDTTSSEYDALAEDIYTDVGSITDEAYSLMTDNFKYTEADTLFIGQCAVITLDTVVFPHELIIDFGPENCLCKDGRYRRGKIVNTFTGRYREPGTIITHGFDEYFVNDNKVEGIRVMTNMGYNINGNLYYTIEVNGMITLANGAGTITWNASKEREWVEGSDTPERWDDVYLITGDGSGVRPSGQSWIKEITKALRKELSCRFFVSGTMEITPEGKPTRILDYGDGTCDNIATVTVNGHTYTIHLH
jgi:hypothetical protein